MSDVRSHITQFHEGKKTLCKDGFLNKHQYETHFESNHNGMKPYKCIKCDDCFTDKIKLKRHVGSVHDDSKHFCSYCKGS